MFPRGWSCSGFGVRGLSSVQILRNIVQGSSGSSLLKIPRSSGGPEVVQSRGCQSGGGVVQRSVSEVKNRKNVELIRTRFHNVLFGNVHLEIGAFLRH